MGKDGRRDVGRDVGLPQPPHSPNPLIHISSNPLIHRAAGPYSTAPQVRIDAPEHEVLGNPQMRSIVIHRADRPLIHGMRSTASPIKKWG